MRKSLGQAVSSLLLVSGGMLSADAIAQTPNPSYVLPGKNAFVEYGVWGGNPSHALTDAETKAKLYHYYYKYFEEPNGASRLFFDKTINGKAMAVIVVPSETQPQYDANGNPTGVTLRKVKSEGQSYGMMIAVQLDKQEVFKKLWRFAKAKMQRGCVQKNKLWQCNRFFRWRMNEDGSESRDPNAAGKPIVQGDLGPAPDGEVYFAMSLLLAAERGWANDPGEPTFTAEANEILSHMITGNYQSGPLVNATYKLLVFSPGEEASGNGFTDASYQVPAFFHYFANHPSVPTAHRMTWGQVRDAARNYLSYTAHYASGLHPEYGKYTSSAAEGWYWPKTTPYNPISHHSAYDSFRTAMNIAMDHAWNGQNYGDTVLKNRLTTYKNKTRVNNVFWSARYRNVYTWEGNDVGSETGTRGHGLMAMNAVAALDKSDFALKKEHLERLYWEDPYFSEYYNNLLYLLGMLNLTGDYKTSW